MTDQNNAAQAAEQPLPSYGKLPFHQLGQDVVEAMMGVRQPFDFGPNYPGHAMCLINFNSLARIVDKYRLPVASAPVAGEAQRIFLVPTGEVYCGQETYTRHEGQPPVNTDNECLYVAPQASAAVRDANALMAAEYQQWIDWFHKGRDYDSFLKDCVLNKPPG